MPEPHSAAGSGAAQTTMGKRFPRRERKRHLAQAKELRIFFASAPHYASMPDGSLRRIADPEAMDIIARLAMRCIGAGGEVQFARLPSDVAMRLPGAEQRRKAGTSRCWVAVAFDLDGRLTSVDLWVGAPPGATEAQERAGVVARLEATLAENLKGGFPSRSPRPRLAVFNG